MFIYRDALPTFLKILADGKIAIVLGARQVGKTTLVSEALRDAKVLMLNFDLPFDISRFKAASVLPPQDGMKALGSPDILVLDEAQREPDAARIIVLPISESKFWYQPSTAIILCQSPVPTGVA